MCRFVGSCDNIDVLEATVDEKNTFHCTQMMVWQRAPSPEHREHTAGGRDSGRKGLLRSRAASCSVLKDFQFQRLGHATLPPAQKP